MLVAGSPERADACAGGEEPAEQRGAEDEEEPRGHRQPKGDRSKEDGWFLTKKRHFQPSCSALISGLQITSVLKSQLFSSSTLLLMVKLYLQFTQTSITEKGE